jgi:hypothetical protein
MIVEADFTVSKAHGMLGTDVSGDPADRTAADNQTVRGVFMIGPDNSANQAGQHLARTTGEAVMMPSTRPLRGASRCRSGRVRLRP